MGAALVLACQYSMAATTECQASGSLQWAELQQVVDGDTLRLKDGRKIRLIAVNTPELSGGRQAFAKEAKVATTAFFAESRQVGLKLGVDEEDRYGRQLAHVYRQDGVSLSAHLLALGLAMQVVVPANVGNWRCYDRVERQAQRLDVGMWQSENQPMTTAQLTVRDSGFQWLEGVVRSVERSSDSWWLMMDDLAVRLRDRDLAYFEDKKISTWQGRVLRIRGWVIDRSQSQSVTQRGYPALMMNLQHPAMLK